MEPLWYPYPSQALLPGTLAGPGPALTAPAYQATRVPPPDLRLTTETVTPMCGRKFYVEVVQLIVSAMAGRPCNTRHPSVPRPYPLTVILACHICDHLRVRSGSIVFSRLCVQRAIIFLPGFGPSYNKKSLYRHHMHSTGMIVSYTRLLTISLFLPYNRGER